MFAPGLIGLGSRSKRVRLDSVGSYITTPPLTASVTVDTIIDNLPSRPDSLLLLWVGTYSNTLRFDTATVSRNSENFTVGQAIIGGQNEAKFSLWYRLNPSASDGGGVTITSDRDAFAASSRLCLIWAYLYNVNQTTPLNARVTDTDLTANPILTTSPLSGAVDRYPIAAVFGRDADGSVNWTSGAEQTRLHTSVTNDSVGAAIDTCTPGATTNFSITGQITTPFDAMMIAMNVNAA